MIFWVRLFNSTPVFLLLSLTIMCVAMSPGPFYPHFLGEFNLLQLSSFLFYIFFSVIILFLVPAITNKIFFRENLKALGLEVPKNKILSVILILIALFLFAFPLASFTHQANFKMQYPHELSSMRLFFMILFFPFYYFAEEFFFRGFLFLTLWKKVKWHSFWITDIIFTLSHFGKPGMEVLLCIPGSVIFNCLTLATRSIFPAFIVHTTLGVCFILGMNS